MPRAGREYADALKLSAVGIALVLCIAIGTGAGMWLDRRFGTEPVMTIIGFVVGTAAGFRELLKAAGGGRSGGG